MNLSLSSTTSSSTLSSLSSSLSSSSASSKSWFSGIVRGHSDRSSSVKMVNNSTASTSDTTGPVVRKNQFLGVLLKYDPNPIQGKGLLCHTHAHPDYRNLQQNLPDCSNPANASAVAKEGMCDGARSPSSDVPAGHVAVCVGASRRRFIVRTTYLNPIFKKLLVEAEEEYDFCTQGPLTIPCNESLFEEALRAMSGYPTRYLTLEDLQERCHVDAFSNFDPVGGESWPLLHDAPIC